MLNINDLSYNPTTNPEFFTRALFGGQLIKKGIFRVMTGVKGDELLTDIDLENEILQIDGLDCAWTPNQIIKLSEKLATVKTYKINLEECIKDLEKRRTAYMMKDGANTADFPDELEEATLYLLSIGLSNEIEKMLISGDPNENPNHIAGMQTVLVKSKEAIKIVTPAITKANIIQTVEKAYTKVPEEVLQAEDSGTLYIMMSYAQRRILRTALADVSNQTIVQNWSVSDTDPKNPIIFYLGMEVIAVKGIGKNTMMVNTYNNGILLTDLLSDLDTIEMGQMEKPNHHKVWIDGRLRLGFVIPFEEQAVIVSDLFTEDQEAGGTRRLDIVPNSLTFANAGETKSFTILSEIGEAVETLAQGSGFKITQAPSEELGGIMVTVVSVDADHAEGSINSLAGQVLVRYKDPTYNRSATVMLSQTNSQTYTLDK